MRSSQLKLLRTGSMDPGTQVHVPGQDLEDEFPLRATATGSTTARSLADRFGEVFNVKDYGATGDGVTDDRAAFAAALTAAAAASGVVVIPSGTYAIGDRLTIPSNVRIVGAGIDKTVLLLTNNLSGGSWINGDGVSNVEIEGMTLNSDRATNTNTLTVLYINNTTSGSDVTIRSVRVLGSTSGGIAVDNTTRARVIGCEVQDTVAADCIRMASGTDVAISHCWCWNLASLASNRRAIQVGSCSRAIISDNKVDGVPSGGAMACDVGGTTDCVIADNIFTDCGAGIDLENGTRRCTIVGNVLEGKGLVNGFDIGIYAVNLTVEDIVISGNKISDFFVGIRLNGTVRATVSANIITDCQSAGITCADNAAATVTTEVTISGNIIRNCSAQGGGLAPALSLKIDVGNVADNIIIGANHSYAIVDNAANTHLEMSGNVMGNGTSGTTMNRAKTIRRFDLQGLFVYVGIATPEGSVAAPIGSLYMREDGGAGTSLYVKESGTGNTGWVAK